MKHRVVPIAFALNSFYLSFLYFRLFWLSSGKVTGELLTYKYMLYSVFMVYPLFMISALIFSKEFKGDFFIKFLVWALMAAVPLLYFYSFDLFDEKELFYGYIFTLIQCLFQSKMIKDEEMGARVAGVFAAKLLLWFVTLILSLSFLIWYSDRDILMNMLFGGFYYLFAGILDIVIVRYKFLTEK